jgi:1,4-alpha-glucan branching enzyme
MSKFFLYSFIRQEFDAFIVFKQLRERSSSCMGTTVTEETHLHAALVHFRIWAGRRRKVDGVRGGENIVGMCCFRQIPALS